MNIYGTERGLGASYGARRIENNEKVYGIGIIKVDDKKSYLIQQFSTNDFTDGAPALAYYVAVQTDSIFLLNKDDVLDVLLETDNLHDNKANDGPVKRLTKEDYNFGQRIVTPFIDE